MCFVGNSGHHFPMCLYILDISADPSSCMAERSACPLTQDSGDRAQEERQIPRGVDISLKYRERCTRFCPLLFTSLSVLFLLDPLFCINPLRFRLAFLPSVAVSLGVHTTPPPPPVLLSVPFFGVPGLSSSRRINCLDAFLKGPWNTLW